MRKCPEIQGPFGVDINIETVLTKSYRVALVVAQSCG